MPATSKPDSTTPRDAFGRPYRLPVAIALIAAVGLWERLQFVALYGGAGSYLDWADVRYFGSLSRSYVDAAHRLAATGRYETLLYPPGYAGVLAALITMGVSTPEAWRVAQAAGDAAVALAVYGLARGVGLRRSASLAASLAYALHPLWAAGSVFLLAEALSPALLIAVLASVTWAARVDASPRWIGPGAAIGACTLVRPDLLIAAAPAAVYAIVLPGRWRDRRVGALVVGLVLVLLPWGVHNRATHGAWIFTSTSGGNGLFEGLGDIENPYGFVADDSAANRVLMAAGLRWGTPEANAYLTRRYWRAVVDHPAHVARAAAYRWRRILFDSDRLQPLVFGRVREAVDALGLILCVLALFLMRDNRALCLAIVAPVSVALLGPGLVHFEPRYVRYSQLSYLFAGAAMLDYAHERAPRLAGATPAALGLAGLGAVALAYIGVQFWQLHRAAEVALGSFK